MTGGTVEQIIEAIREREVDAHKAARELAALYAKLVAEAGGFRAAARVAAEHGLAYADHSSLRRLVYWGELCDGIDLETEGGDHGPHPSERQVRPLLTEHFWTEAGPGGLAELWTEHDGDLKAFIAAAKEQWPRPKPKPRKPSLRPAVKGVVAEGGYEALLAELKAAIGEDGIVELERLIAQSFAEMQL